MRQRCLLYHILPLVEYTSRETGIYFSLLLRNLWWMQIVGYFLAWRSYPCLYITPSHHHCANLSEDIELIKCLSDLFCWVCKIKHILSVIHYTICGAVCSQFTHFPCDGWENIYILCLIIKSEVWTIINYSGLDHETMVCAVFLYVLINTQLLGLYSYSVMKPALLAPYLFQN